MIIYNRKGDKLFEGDNLQGAALVRADLQGADLQKADLTRVELYDAILHDADLRGAILPPLAELLLADWGNLPADLTLECMRWDATICGLNAMDAWAKGGPCPFDVMGGTRLVNFKEARELWQPGPPTLSMEELVERLCQACGVRGYVGKEQKGDKNNG